MATGVEFREHYTDGGVVWAFIAATRYATIELTYGRVVGILGDREERYSQAWVIKLDDAEDVLVRIRAFLEA